MPVPPREVPAGLTADEYRRLSVRYSLIGWVEQAGQATRRCEQLACVDEDREQSEEPDPSDPGFAAGAALADALMKLLSQSPGASDEEGGDALASALEQLTALGVPQEEVDKLLESLSSLGASAQTALPSDVPEGLSASEYLEMGMRYKEIGWTEQARDALQSAIEIDGAGEFGKAALTFLRSKVPRHPVPMMAVQTNIQGFNLMAAGDHAAAEATFAQLLRDYSDFEWPYGNLGSLLLHLGRLDEAEIVLNKALEINPYYLNAVLHLARLHAANDDLDSCAQCLDRASEIDSNDSSAQEIRELLDNLR